MIGIYKITNPKGKIYIGQSIDIDRRFRFYKKINCKSQTKLYNSLKYYGFDNHKFEIITECLDFELNDLERYYQDLYDVSGNMGLNCILTTSKNRSGKMSKESIQKISNANKGRIISEETKIKNSYAQKKLYDNGYVNPMTNKKHKPETIEKIRIKKIGLKISDEVKLKMIENHSSKKNNYINGMKGKNHSSEAIQKISKATQGCKNPMAKIVLDLENGIFYYCAKESWVYNKSNIKIQYKSYIDKLLGKKRNNTKFIYI